MRILLIIIIMVFSGFAVFAQEAAEPQDSLWNLFEYDQDSLEYESDFQVYHSLGWFPTPIPDYYNYSMYFAFGSCIDLARGINSASWVKTTNPYTRTNPFKDEEGYYKKTFSNDELDTEPSRYLVNIGYDFKYGLSIPLVLRVSAEVMFSKGILYSADYSKYFVTWDGERRQIKEVGVITLYEASIRGGIGFEIPFYGAYVKLDNDYLCNTYYLYSGLSASYPFYSEATQYLQIATAKDKIRYDNGRDTLRLVSEQKLPTLTPYRYYLDLGIGLDIEGSGSGASFEFIFGAPLNSVLTDAWWGQLLFNFKISVRIKNIFQ